MVVVVVDGDTIVVVVVMEGGVVVVVVVDVVVVVVAAMTVKVARPSVARHAAPSPAACTRWVPTDVEAGTAIAMFHVPVAVTVAWPSVGPVGPPHRRCTVQVLVLVDGGQLDPVAVSAEPGAPLSGLSIRLGVA